MKLLNIDANAKTVKGQKKGYMTAVLYLAPYISSGAQVCPMAEKAGCWRTCLNTAGRGGMPVDGTFTSPGGIVLPDNTIQRARIARTQLWTSARGSFLEQLERELVNFFKRAEKQSLTPVVRLNGTSDIQWERIRTRWALTFMDMFPHVQFYDYTKIPKRLYDTTLPQNYYLCLSYSAANAQYQKWCLEAERAGHSVVMVARNDEVKARLMAEAAADGIPAVDGDEHDLRFLDPKGARVVLRAKGSAKHEQNGFVFD